MSGAKNPINFSLPGFPFFAGGYNKRLKLYHHYILIGVFAPMVLT